MASNVEYLMQERQESLYAFEDNKYFYKMDPVLLKGEDLLMGNGMDYQAIKAENHESNNPLSYSQRRYSQEQEAIPVRAYQNPVLLTDASQSKKASSHDMFKSSINSNSTVSNSTASDCFSKPLTPTDPSPDSIACGSTSNKEMEDMLSSSVASVPLIQCPTSVQNFPQTQPSMTFNPFQHHIPLDASPFAPSAMHRNESSSSHSTASASYPDTQESAEDIAIRRAEQNRAAQRAFRQRKQKYIKWLESKAEELDEVYRILALVRAENQQLCNLVKELDGKLNGVQKADVNILISTGSVSSSKPGAVATGNVLNQALSNGLNGKGMYGIDESLRKEISMRLMKLSTMPDSGSGGDRDLAMSRKFKCRKTIASSKGSGFKGKMAYKMSQQSRHQEELLQAVLQPSHMLARHQERRSSFSTDMLAISTDQQLQQQNSMPWRRSSFSADTLVVNAGQQLQRQNSIPWTTCPASSAPSSIIGFISSAPPSNNILSTQASTITSVLTSSQSAGNFLFPSTLITSCADPAVYIHQLSDTNEFNGVLQDPRGISSLQYSPLSKQIDALSEGNILQHQVGIMSEAKVSQQRACSELPLRNNGQYQQQSGIAAAAYNLGSIPPSSAPSPIPHGANGYVHTSVPQQLQRFHPPHPPPHCNININSDSIQQMESVDT
ncbi:hypothetical protein BGZ51_005686 [Haplosporangium sp. Z 767]|nr:hypothetical protein BGZ51_005686 [Haplosporangium sp. Z 767]KAF9181965.1 hypothetical protein BGZ50_005212 [Haplosporangium sp. Z 11]